MDRIQVRVNCPLLTPAETELHDPVQVLIFLKPGSDILHVAPMKCIHHICDGNRIICSASGQQCKYCFQHAPSDDMSNCPLELKPLLLARTRG